MTKTSFFGFLFLSLLVSTTTVKQLSPKAASALFHKIDFAMVSDKPGAAVAFRMKKKFARQKAFVCFRGECFRVQRRWQLVATDPTVRGKQKIVIAGADQSYAFRKIALNDDMFESAHNAIAKLRLPASVMADIEANADKIPLEQTKDQHLYADSLKRPWSTVWILPLKSAVTSEFGSLRVPPNGSPYAHTGVDLRAGRGTPVRATSDGIVVGTDEEVIYGNVVTVDHGYGLMTRYMHLSSFDVNPGDRVKAGDVIGLSGATGRAEAPHLHWEMRIRGRPVDPLSTRRLLARLSDLE